MHGRHLIGLSAKSLRYTRTHTPVKNRNTLSAGSHTYTRRTLLNVCCCYRFFAVVVFLLLSLLSLPPLFMRSVVVWWQETEVHLEIIGSRVEWSLHAAGAKSATGVLSAVFAITIFSAGPLLLLLYFNTRATPPRRFPRIRVARENARGPRAVRDRSQKSHDQSSLRPPHPVPLTPR